jgi:hypothetical protein
MTANMQEAVMTDRPRVSQRWWRSATALVMLAPLLGACATDEMPDAGAPTSAEAPAAPAVEDSTPQQLTPEQELRAIAALREREALLNAISQREAEQRYARSSASPPAATAPDDDGSYRSAEAEASDEAERRLMNRLIESWHERHRATAPEPEPNPESSPAFPPIAEPTPSPEPQPAPAPTPEPTPGPTTETPPPAPDYSPVPVPTPTVETPLIATPSPPPDIQAGGGPTQQPPIIDADPPGSRCGWWRLCHLWQ